MKIFKGLHFAIFIITAAAAWYTTPRTNSSDLVFGVELDENGASCAVSLPSGQIRHLCFVKGDQRYTELWSKWYHFSAGSLVNDPEHPLPTTDHVRAVQAEWNRILDPVNMSWKDWFGQFVGRRSSTLEELYALDYYQEDEATEILSTTLRPLRDTVLDLLNHTEPQFEKPYVNVALPGWLFQELHVFSQEHIDAGAPEDDTYITAHGYRQFTSRISTAIHRTGFRQWQDADPLYIMQHHFAGDRTGGPLAAPDMAIRQAFLPTREQYAVRAFVKWETLGNDSLISTWVERVVEPLMDQAAWTSMLVSAESTEDEVLNLLRQTAKALNAAKMELVGDTSHTEEGLSALLSGSWWTTDSIAHLEKFLPAWDSRTKQEEESLAAIGAAEAARDLYSSFFDTMCVFEMPDIVEEDKEL